MTPHATQIKLLAVDETDGSLQLDMDSTSAPLRKGNRFRILVSPPNLGMHVCGSMYVRGGVEKVWTTCHVANQP